MMPLARALLYYLVYFSIFTGLAMTLREPFSNMNVPNHFLPVVLTCGMMIPVYIVMALMLVVIRPEKLFAYEKKSRRWARLLVYVGLFVLFSVILPFFPANAESNFSWIAGVQPLFLFMLMVQPIKPPVKLASVPKSRDSRWRHLKYSGIYFLSTLAGAAGVLGYAAYLGVGNITTESITWPLYIGNGMVYLVQIFLLHRMIVTKPHSRFDHMPTMARYKRFAAYIFFFATLGVAAPWITNVYWQWEMTDFSLAIAIIFFFCAAYGTDGTPFKGVTIFSGPTRATKNGMNTTIKRRLNELAEKNGSMS